MPGRFCESEVRQGKINPGSQAKITVTVDTGKMPADAGLVNSRLSVITNDPSRPSSPIRIVGELTD